MTKQTKKNPFNQIPILESERLILRGFNENDIIDIFEYASIDKVTEFLPWNTHKSLDDTKAFLKMTKENFEKHDNIDFAIVLKTENKVVGGISIRKWNNPNKCADIGYVLSPVYWGRGLITEAIKHIIKFGFEELNTNRIEAHCDENNIGSYRAMEKAGMKYEGTLREKTFMKGKFINAKFYSILKSEFTL
ncbi:MAG: GNAT family N-acetyltransferase [Ignavibacteria bacterium]|nr:GNAT family N-acetyltransferase [Ignavibacteria bacterium]